MTRIERINFSWITVLSNKRQDIRIRSIRQIRVPRITCVIRVICVLIITDKLSFNNQYAKNIENRNHPTSQHGRYAGEPDEPGTQHRSLCRTRCRTGRAARVAQHALFLPDGGHAPLRPGRTYPRPVHGILLRTGRLAGHRAGHLAVRETRAGTVSQHRRGLRERREHRRQIPQDAHPRRPGLLREILLHPRRPGL